MSQTATKQCGIIQQKIIKYPPKIGIVGGFYKYFIVDFYIYFSKE